MGRGLQVYIRLSPGDFRVKKYITRIPSSFLLSELTKNLRLYVGIMGGVAWGLGTTAMLGWRLGQKNNYVPPYLSFFHFFWYNSSCPFEPALSEGGEWWHFVNNNIRQKEEGGWEENQGTVTKREGGIFCLFLLGLPLDYLGISKCISVWASSYNILISHWVWHPDIVVFKAPQVIMYIARIKI